MSTCSITITTRGPEHPEADTDQKYSEETRVTVTTWGGSSFEFGDKTESDLSDLQQAFQFIYIAGVMDSGGDVDVALERYRAMLRDQRPPAPRFTADEVTAARDWAIANGDHDLLRIVLLRRRLARHEALARRAPPDPSCQPAPTSGGGVAGNSDGRPTTPSAVSRP